MNEGNSNSDSPEIKEAKRKVAEMIDPLDPLSRQRVLDDVQLKLGRYAPGTEKSINKSLDDLGDLQKEIDVFKNRLATNGPKTPGYNPGHYKRDLAAVESLKAKAAALRKDSSLLEVRVRALETISSGKLRYLTFVETHEKNVLYPPDGGDAIKGRGSVDPTIKSAISSHLKDAHHFILSEKFLETIKIPGAEDIPFLSSEPMELPPRPAFLGNPFPVVWLEAMGQSVLGRWEKGEGISEILGTLVLDLSAETGRQTYWVVFLELVNNFVNGFDVETAGYILDEKKYDFNKSSIHAWLFALFQALGTAQLGEERINERVRVGSGKNREFVKIKKIVHVRPKRPANAKPLPEHVSRVIEWSHSWEVRGHWRKVPTLGKDQHGNYCIPNFTWVVPSIKGKGKLVKKTRFVHSD